MRIQTDNIVTNWTGNYLIRKFKYLNATVQSKSPDDKPFAPYSLSGGLLSRFDGVSVICDVSLVGITLWRPSLSKTIKNQIMIWIRLACCLFYFSFSSIFLSPVSTLSSSTLFCKCVSTPYREVNLGGVVANVQDQGFVLNKFELQLRYNIHFQTNTLGKYMNPLISQLFVK